MSNPHLTATSTEAWVAAASRRIDSMFTHLDRALVHLYDTNATLARFVAYER